MESKFSIRVTRELHIHRPITLHKEKTQIEKFINNITKNNKRKRNKKNQNQLKMTHVKLLLDN